MKTYIILEKRIIFCYIYFFSIFCTKVFQKIRQFFIRRYFKFAVSLLRKITEPFKRLYGLEETCEVYLSQERSRVKRGTKERVATGFAGRYGTVVILKTIIRASGGRPQVSQGRTVTAISIASQ